MRSRIMATGKYHLLEFEDTEIFFGHSVSQVNRQRLQRAGRARTSRALPIPCARRGKEHCNISQRVPFSSLRLIISSASHRRGRLERRHVDVSRRAVAPELHVAGEPDRRVPFDADESSQTAILRFCDPDSDFRFILD